MKSSQLNDADCKCENELLNNLSISDDTFVTTTIVLPSLNECKTNIIDYIDSFDKDDVTVTFDNYLRNTVAQWPVECYDNAFAVKSSEDVSIDVVRDCIVKLTVCMKFVQNEKYENIPKIDGFISYFQDVLEKWDKFIRKNTVNALAPEILEQIFKHIRWPGLFRLKQINKKWRSVIGGMSGVGQVDVFRYLMLDKTRNIHQQIRCILQDRSKYVEGLCMVQPHFDTLEEYMGVTYPTVEDMNSVVALINSSAVEKFESIDVSELSQSPYMTAAYIKSLLDEVVLHATNLKHLTCFFTRRPYETIDLSLLNQLRCLKLSKVVPSGWHDLNWLEELQLENIKWVDHEQGAVQDDDIRVLLPMVKTINLDEVKLEIAFDISQSRQLVNLRVGNNSKGISFLGFDVDVHKSLEVFSIIDCPIDRSSLAKGRSGLNKLNICVAPEPMEFYDSCMVVAKLAASSTNQLQQLWLNFPPDLTDDQISVSSPLLAKLLPSQLNLQRAILQHLQCRKYDLIHAIMTAGEELLLVGIGKAQCSANELCLELVNPLRDVTSSRRLNTLKISAIFTDDNFDNDILSSMLSEFNIDISPVR